MSETIQSYRDAKKQMEKLQKQAKTEMESRFTALINEAAGIALEYKADFGSLPALPAVVKSISFNSDAKPVAKKTRLPKTGEAAATQESASAEEPVQISGKKLGGLKRSFNSLSAKIAAAKAEGKPTKDLEDELYRVGDELTLAGVNVESLAAEPPAPVAAASAPAPPTNGQVHPF